MKYREINLIGGFYADASLPWSSQDVSNWLPIQDESGQARSEWALIGAPGLRTVAISISTLRLSGEMPVGKIGDAYTYTFTASGGTEPYSFVYSGLPAGLSGLGATVSGTPTQSGVSLVQVTVTDATGVSVTTYGTLYIANVESIVPDPPSGGGGITPSDRPTRLATIPNASFEDGASDWTVVSRTPAISPGFSVVTTGGRTGANCAEWTGNTDDGGSSSFDRFENSKAIWKASEYVVDVWVRCTAIDSGATARGTVEVQSYQDAAKTIPLGSTVGAFALFTAVGDWKKVSVIGGLGPYVSVRLLATTTLGGATLQFDDVAFDGLEYVS